MDWIEPVMCSHRSLPHFLSLPLSVFLRPLWTYQEPWGTHNLDSGLTVQLRRAADSTDSVEHNLSFSSLFLFLSLRALSLSLSPSAALLNCQLWADKSWSMAGALAPLWPSPSEGSVLRQGRRLKGSSKPEDHRLTSGAHPIYSIHALCCKLALAFCDTRIKKV